MKFHQISIGSRFIVDDQEYRKTSPVLAQSLNDNKPRLFPRSFEVQSADDTTTPQAKKTATALGIDEVVAALTTFYQDCQKLVDSLEIDPQNNLRARNVLAEARQQCLHTLGIADKT